MRSFRGLRFRSYVDVTEATHDLNLRRGAPYKLCYFVGLLSNHRGFIDFNGDGDFLIAGKSWANTQIPIVTDDGIAFYCSFRHFVQIAPERLRLPLFHAHKAESLMNDDYGQTIININLFAVNYCIPLAKASASILHELYCNWQWKQYGAAYSTIWFLHFTIWTNSLQIVFHQHQVKTAQSSVLTLMQRQQRGSTLMMTDFDDAGWENWITKCTCYG